MREVKMKYKFKRRPRPYQLGALKKALKFDKLAIWFDPGLGKTKVAIDYSAIQIARGNLQKILIVCPLSAIGVWRMSFPKIVLKSICQSYFLWLVI
jgi:superfamily II DNA or RNA helicase